MDQNEIPKKLLLAGVEILDPVLCPHGFLFALGHHAKGSGGWFASGSYSRNARRLELHFRKSLGMVTYHLRGYSLDHEVYMRLLGVYGSNLYPDFPSHPLESFQHLASDLKNYCGDFLAGDGTQFSSLAERHREAPDKFRGVPE